MRQYTAGRCTWAGRGAVSAPGRGWGRRLDEYDGMLPEEAPESSSPGGAALSAVRRAAVRSSSYQRNSGVGPTPTQHSCHGPHPQVRLDVQQRPGTALVGVRVAGGGEQRHEPGQRLERQSGVLARGAAPGVAEPAQPVPQRPLVQRFAVEQRQYAEGEVVPLQQPSNAEGVQAGTAQ
ncbi:hypothetical protein WKI65_22520 [Streptomyces sp. MS1.AVA.3]|uniref:hypothetical protein n=1 Tax=Streptomyces decoyicus TaxID=249567 RepID=UPI0030BB75FB